MNNKKYYEKIVKPEYLNMVLKRKTAYNFLLCSGVK